MDRVSQRLKFKTKMTHGRKQQRNFVSVVANITRLFCNLGKQDDVAPGFGLLQGRLIKAKLVTEDQYELGFIHGRSYDSHHASDPCKTVKRLDSTEPRSQGRCIP